MKKWVLFVFVFGVLNLSSVLAETADPTRRAGVGGTKPIYIGSCWVKGAKEKKAEHFTAAALDEGFGLRLADQRCVGRQDSNRVTEAFAENNDCECEKREDRTNCTAFQQKCALMKVRMVACQDATMICPLEKPVNDSMRDANSNGASSKVNNGPAIPRDPTQVKVKSPVQREIPGSNGYSAEEGGRLTPAIEEMQNAESQ